MPAPTDQAPPQQEPAQQAPAQQAPAGDSPPPDFWREISWREPRVAWRQIVERVGLTKLVIGAVVLVLVLGAFALPTGAERADPFDGPGAALDLMLKLGAVLALAYVSMAALKRYTSGPASRRGVLLEVLDSTTLGPNRAVYVVRAGRKRLVLGVTQHQITPLGELDEGTPE